MTLAANLQLIHEAGATHLPTAAGIYDAASADVTNVAPPVGTGGWSALNAEVAAILTEAGGNLQAAGDVLRLLAWELAERDGLTSDLLQRTGLDSVPELTPDGWSDED
ncbi:MAG TPA: hypothetical protein H9881_18270 [Candidatus Stackebrandtia excrementipullorum]|nr:hypothetical protein [Candidatus Stackebrandtia excrementipullorum]